MSQQLVEDVQAVIDALTEEQRWIWVSAAQYDDDEQHMEFFTTRAKAVTYALDFARNAAETGNIDAEMHSELEQGLKAPGTSGLSTCIDGVLYFNIYRVQVQ